eukprot:gene59410-81318_t
MFALLLTLAQASVSAAPPVIPPTGPALTEEVEARDAEFFRLFFEGCDPARVATMLAPDFEMYHDKGGKIAGGAAAFVADYAKACADAAKPDGWRHRRALEGLTSNGATVPGLDPAVFKGKVSIVNVWASWCVPCHEEAPLLTVLGEDKRLQLVGINYKDSADNARRFLGRYGNPFSIVGVDGNGRGAIEWG